MIAHSFPREWAGEPPVAGSNYQAKGCDISSLAFMSLLYPLHKFHAPQE